MASSTKPPSYPGSPSFTRMVSRASPTEVLAFAVAHTKSISASSSLLGSRNLSAASSSLSARARCALMHSIAILRPCSHPIVSTPNHRKEAPRVPGPPSLLLLSVWVLPDAYHLLDLLGEGLLLLLSPTTLMFLVPMARFLLHQPALGNPACLSFEVAVPLRVAHRRSPPSSQATPAVSINKPLPAGMGR
jgi:hypothetical protein